jgi:hypothetical protein
MNTYKVACHSCGDSWQLAGTWSAYERDAMESRPCPHCDAYTLSSPEPTTAPARRRAPWPTTAARAELALRVG